jgi:myo-inositol 2-dehydrogenase/D-chiro-inositol 1-dehydrogenase
MSVEEVRFGLIGYGLFGTHHAAAIAAAPGARLAAVAVKSEKSRQAARNAHPAAEVTGDYRQLLERDDIDIVSVVVPNQMHFEVARDALKAGKHVLLEKPMALSASDCDQLIQLAERRQRLLAVGHELRLSSLWGRVRDLIDQGAIGHPQYALIELSRFPYRQGAEGWRWDIDRVGSWILEEPIHFFDLARWYLEACGPPQSVYARANSRHADRPELKDNFSATVNFADGAWAIVSQSLAAFGHHQTAKIAGTEGAVWAWWSAADARSGQSQFGLRYGLGDQVHEESFEKPAGELLELADEVRVVAECVRSGNQPPCTGSDGRWSVLMCLAAEQSVRDEKVVAFDDFLSDRG